MALDGRGADDVVGSREAHGFGLSAQGDSLACAASEGTEQGWTVVVRGCSGWWRMELDGGVGTGGVRRAGEAYCGGVGG